MSKFSVEVVKISSITPHNNADRLEIALIEGMGYTVITAKSNFQPGDLAYYFPIDSVIPEPLLDKFGIRPYYSKKLRAAKLRGIFSEGLLIPVGKDFSGSVGDDYTEYFGVEKYEYPIPQNMNGDVEAPIGQFKFPAPENLKRYKDILIEGEPVVVTEKIHGTNFTVYVDPGGAAHIGSHNYFWKNNEANQNLVYIRAYNENPALHNLPPNTQVFGEIYGLQDIKYGLDRGKLGIALFAVRRGGFAGEYSPAEPPWGTWGNSFLSYPGFTDFCARFSLPMVPVLFTGAYSWDKVAQFNNASSSLHPGSIQEGVCVQPVFDRTHPEIDRVVLKLISDRYLLRREGTELH